jgi:hypothetical protein
VLLSNALSCSVAFAVGCFVQFEPHNDLDPQYLKSSKIIASPQAEASLLAVDRANYVRDPEEAYIDAPMPIGM